MAEYKLTYFDTQGLAEPIRYLFAIVGVQFEDERLPKDEHWPRLVPEVKARFPWGTVPVLTYKGIQISQSIAIMRFLANKFNLVGVNELESAQCDEVVDCIKDWTSQWIVLFYEADEKKKAEVQAKLLSEVNPKYFTKFNQLLSGKDYIVGSSLTWADICLAHAMFSFGNRKDCGHLKEYPNLKSYVEKFHAIPSVVNWMKNRPVTTL